MSDRPRVYVTCEFCGTPLLQTSLRRHQQTEGCRVYQKRQALNKRGFVQVGGSEVAYLEDLFGGSTPLVEIHPTWYWRGGWGRSGVTKDGAWTPKWLAKLMDTLDLDYPGDDPKLVSSNSGVAPVVNNLILECLREKRLTERAEAYLTLEEMAK